VKFLVDHQLPPALARFICSLGHDASHVREIALKDAHDLTIWRHAMSQGMVVVSKDEDFTFLANVPGDTGKLLWVRMGNCRKRVLFDALSAHLPQIVKEFDSGGRIVELR
jgi:predicted nuclease of predicted toxin-antitoxin system